MGLIKKILNTLIDRRIEDLVDLEVRKQMSVNFENARSYLEDKIDARLSSEIRIMRETIRSEIHTKVSDGFKDDGDFHYKMRLSVKAKVGDIAEETKRLINKTVEGEKFIDDVIARINRKQIK